MFEIVYKIWSEWDLGIEHELFATEELAWQALRRGVINCDILDNEVDSFENLVDENLVGVQECVLVR